jgi:ADP-ribose pyrophosphatase YjhB (NUDIX family)
MSEDAQCGGGVGIVSPQRKVTAFVTRGSGVKAELLVFWHAGAGTQVPSGTVEEGEPFDVAARREAAEETGLADLELVAELGVRSYDLPPGQAVLVRQVFLQTRPGRDGPPTAWSFRNIGVRVVDEQDGYARIVYEERDLDSAEADDALVVARFEGWVPMDALRFRQERAFYHFRVHGESPEEWQQLENDKFVFHLSWMTLTPKPTGLIVWNQAWLDEWYDDLLAGVGDQVDQVGDSK